MSTTAYKKTTLVGGGAAALDGIDGAGLLDGDFAFVTLSNINYLYILDDDSAAAESSPDVISPDANAGNKRWIRQGCYGNIKFPATQVPSADANTLDDYEEGTWTPALRFGGAAVNMTYSMQLGRYTKIGRVVTAVASMILTEKGDSTGAATVAGLPFAASTLSYPVTVYLQTVTFANQSQGLLASGATEINLQEITEAGNLSNLTEADFADTSRVYASVVYYV
jgi:hypothetical protein